jgi:hypothetical protein
MSVAATGSVVGVFWRLVFCELKSKRSCMRVSAEVARLPGDLVSELELSARGSSHHAFLCVRRGGEVDSDVEREVEAPLDRSRNPRFELEHRRGV